MQKSSLFDDFVSSTLSVKYIFCIYYELLWILNSFLTYNGGVDLIYGIELRL